MLGQNIHRVCNHGKVILSRSMLFYSSESGIFYLKYGIEEFSSRVILWDFLNNSRDLMISGVNLVMHADVFA